MLAKKNRLKRKKDFKLILKEGKMFKEDFLILKFVKNNLNQSRFGIIVSQKISKKAILRNKVKRRIRESIKMELAEIKNGFDITLIAVPGLETKSFHEIKGMIDKIFAKTKILKIHPVVRQDAPSNDGAKSKSKK